MVTKKLTLLARVSLLFSCFLFVALCQAQYNWKLEKSKNGINVYTSDIKGSSFKVVKVECNITGTYTKLLSILTNVGGFHKWIYNNKRSQLLKQYTPYDFIYYSETSMPFPFSNRDVIIRMQIKTDSLPKFLTISGSHQKDYLPEIPGRERLHFYKASWKVTMPTASTLHISYLLELDPGGKLPGWLANSFADKGPFGTFNNLADLLKK